MTQADSVHSTPPTNTSPELSRVHARAEKTDRLLRWGAAYREIDGDLSDLVNMGKIAAKLASSSEEDLAIFAVYQLERMLIRFKEKYDHDEWIAPGPDAKD